MAPTVAPVVTAYVNAAHAVIQYGNYAAEDLLDLYNMMVSSAAKAKVKTALDLMRIARNQARAASTLAAALPGVLPGTPKPGATYDHRAQALAALASSHQVLVKTMAAMAAYRLIPASSVGGTQDFYDYTGYDLCQTLGLASYASGVGYAMDAQLLTPGFKPLHPVSK